VVGASTVAIAIAQLPAGRWSERRRKPRVLIANAALWAGAAILGALALRADGLALWALGVGYGVVFGVGECLFSAALQPLVVELVPPAQLARFNGVLSASFSVALAVGPMLGFGLAEHVSPYAFWAVVIAAMAAAMSLWAYVGRMS
jgi:MFS family permease